MNQGRTVFWQLISFLPDREFRRCVERYQGDLRLRGFSCWDQYLATAFAQLTYRESLRDIEACLGSLQSSICATSAAPCRPMPTLASEGLKRIAELYAIEGEIRGRPPDERLALRSSRARPLLDLAQI